MTDRRDRYAGVLLGLAKGAALAPVIYTLF